jgi:hypothetical protein
MAAPSAQTVKTVEQIAAKTTKWSGGFLKDTANTWSALHIKPTMNVGDSAKYLFAPISDLAKAPFRVMGWIGKGAGWASVEVAKGAGKASIWGLKQPFIGIGKLATGTAKLAWNHKIPTLAIAGTGAAIAVANGSRDRAAAQTQQELIAQAMGGGQQACGPAITPEEYAQMEARMKQGGPGQTGFAEAIAAKRESATVTPQTAASL